MLRTLRAIFIFELRYQVKQPLVYATTLILMLLAFGAVTTDSIRVGGAIGNVHRNAPFVIMQLLTVLSVIGMFVITAFVASAANRDFEHGTAPLFFSKPVSNFDYLAGRFAGSLVVSVAVFVGAAAGIAIGSFMPWLEPERLGPFSLTPYLYTFAVFIVPNLVFIGAVFFTLASTTRSLMFTYLGVVGFFIIYAVAGTLLGNLENQVPASLLDPFGLSSLGLATRYWTVVERNTALPPLGAGSLLLNRAIWIAIGLAVLAAGFLVFDPARPSTGRRRRARPQLSPIAALPAGRLALEEVAVAEAGSGRPLAVASTRCFSAGAQIRQFIQQARLEVVSVVKSIPFVVLLAFGMTNVLASVRFANEVYGSPVLPVTHLMLEWLAGTFLFLLVIIVIFYSGELVWKERALKLNEVYDSLPVPTWATFASKLAALVVVVVSFSLVGALTTAGFQLYRGYHHLEPLLYLKGLAVTTIPFLLIAVLAVFLQVLANSKFLGYLLMILYLISGAVLRSLDFDHQLYHFAGSPAVLYSDMNGYGHFVTPFLWFSLYWTFLALVLFGLSLLLRVRGTESSWRQRWRQAAARFHGPVRALVAGGLLGFVVTGAYIYYNTNVLNPYVPGDKLRNQQADYEKKYRRYRDIAMPRITAVKADVDIFPRERRLAVRGHYQMRNKTTSPIDTLHVTLPPRVKVLSLRFRDHTEVLRDRALGYSIYRFARPLAPGEEMALDFELAVTNPGFVNNDPDTSLVYNGTFFNNRQYFPVLGYEERRQLIDRNERRKRGLLPVDRMAKVDDLFARRNTYLTRDSDWIDFETTVSTSADQIAIAPGYLQRQWRAGDRRYFHYKMDAPILHFFSYLSAAYKVRRDSWKGVAIEIYYQEPHTYNLGRMVDSIKKSLDYYTANFGPYQHRQVRILEFPDYERFAQSFPNTIPYSESIGFIADLKDQESIDYVFYVTAHEVAHQWWAHQVIGGNVQGATMLSETMSQYSALMVMEKEYGKDKMRRFLQYELDRYLSGRGGELVEEMPLMLVENQDYIHYRKGSVVMYALRDYIGEAALNGALARYLAAVKFEQPPYTNTPELLRIIEEATPPERRAMIGDMFSKITLFNNRVVGASYSRRADGRYAVDLTVEAAKVRADGKGVETPARLDDWIDIGVFGEKKDKRSKPQETVLYLAKHRFTEPRTTLHLVVDGLPVQAGIDPYNKLVDRDSKDNRKRVEPAARNAEAKAVKG
ncbi:MAG TPA: M1 family aminopeptidase [Thermoanaerobaculia bacterium]|nr:M1 family aminopeptidase [Thermoanaerobaculia bacterium]